MGLRDQELADPSALADLRGFNPTNAQDDLIDQYLHKTGVTFSRLMDRALREFFEGQGYDWPAKYGRRKAS